MQEDSGTTVWEAKQDIWSNWAIFISPLCSLLVPSNWDMTNLPRVRQRLGLPITQFSHLPQVDTKAITTRSPGATEVTPSPTSSTVPAASWPRTTGSGHLAFPCMKWRSLRQTPAAPTFIFTSPALGGSRSTSSITRGVLASYSTAAFVFIVAPLRLNRDSITGPEVPFEARRGRRWPLSA